MLTSSSFAAAHRLHTNTIAHNIHLNGINCKQRGSLLNGSYLKFKLSQLTGGGSPNKQHCQRIKLKQSTSDNYLNQTGLNEAAGIQLNGQRTTFDNNFQQSLAQSQHQTYDQYHQQNQHHQLILQHQASGAICGTLPRNLSTWKPVNATTNFYQATSGAVGQPSVAFTSDNHQGLIPQYLHLLHNQPKDLCSHQGSAALENSYGIKSNGSITGSTTSPDVYATTTTYSASTSCGSNQPTTHQSAAHFGLPTVSNGSRDHHQQQQEKFGQHSQSVASNNGLANSSAPQTNGYSLGEVGHVEQLVISGKQYIHQTSVNRSLYQGSRGLPQPQRHLQMTSGAYAANASSTLASLTAAVGASRQQQQQSRDNLYTTANSGSMQSMMKDYLSQQQQQQQNNYLQNQPALVCINHGLEKNQTGGIQTKQRLANSDQITASHELATAASHDLANAQTEPGKCSILCCCCHTTTLPIQSTYLPSPLWSPANTPTLLYFDR